MTPYSLDLRQRVLGAVDRGDGPVAAVARTFGVSARWIFKLLRQRRQDGSYAPRPHAGGRPAAIQGDDLERLRQHLAQHPDAFLVEVHQDLHLPGSLTALWRALQRLGLSRKKKRSSPASSAVPRSWPCGRPGSSG